MVKILLSNRRLVIDPVTDELTNAQIVVESIYPWRDYKLIQGGRSGVVLGGKNGSYRTAFVEVFIDNTFIRGEGATVEEAEESAWLKFKARVDCGGHIWEPRKYKNGAGFCKLCNTFGSKIFTGEDLGQLCVVCGKGTLEHYEFDKRDNSYMWFCDDHIPFPNEREEYYNLMFGNDTLGLEDENDDEYYDAREKRMDELDRLAKITYKYQ